MIIQVVEVYDASEEEMVKKYQCKNCPTQMTAINAKTHGNGASNLKRHYEQLHTEVYRCEIKPKLQKDCQDDKNVLDLSLQREDDGVELKIIYKQREAYVSNFYLFIVVNRIV